MARRLKAAQAKLSRAEADALLLRVGQLTREIEAIEGRLSTAVEKLKAEAKSKTEALAKEAKAAFAALVAWAETEKEDLLSGGKRSVQMTHGVIGWRWSPAAVRVAKGVDEECIVATLQRLELARFVRVRAELNREAILEEPAAIDEVPGLTVERSESFYAIPTETQVERVTTVQKLTGAKAREAA